MRRALPLLLVAGLVAAPAVRVRAHDIPNARVDRSIQLTLRPGRLDVDYEVSLAELTLTRDLRDLVGTLPGGDRQDWFDRYGEVTAPLNGKGLLLTVDGRPVALGPHGFELKVEEHPGYTFHYQAKLPPAGRLTLQDTNFVASEGTSRLAVRGAQGVAVRGDSLPGNVEEIAIRPVWQLSDADERRTREVTVEYESPARALPAKPSTAAHVQAKPVLVPSGGATAGTALSRLLDRHGPASLLGLVLVAFGLGAVHAIQPGHGKTLVAATVVAEQGRWLPGVVLALAATVTHTGSVLLIAAGLWATRSTRFSAIHAGLAHGAGFAIAAIGLWRLGRHLAGLGEHDDAPPDNSPRTGLGRRGAISLGVAGGAVPCWDAVALIVLAEALGRLALGVGLLVAFGLGMGSVLTAVGLVAARLRRLLEPSARGAWAERWLGAAGSLVLAAMGVYLMVSS